MRDTVMPYQMFVLHSSYPDGTFRGLEKCCGSFVAEGSTALAVFESRDDAERALHIVGEDGNDWRIVEVTLVAPAVRKPLDSVEFDKVVTGFGL